MIAVITKFVGLLLVSVAALANPTTPKTLSFGASAYVTTNNQIRVAIEKATDKPVAITLRNKANEVLFQQTVAKKDAKYAVKLDVQDLADGEYDLEIKSSEGSIHKQLTLATPTQITSRAIAMQ